MRERDAARILIGLVLAVGLTLASTETFALSSVSQNSLTKKAPRMFKLYHRPSQNRRLKQGSGNSGMNMRANGNHRHLYSLYGNKSKENRLRSPGSMATKQSSQVSGGYR